MIGATARKRRTSFEELLCCRYHLWELINGRSKLFLQVADAACDQQDE
jgi:hypothetical protein